MAPPRYIRDRSLEFTTRCLGKASFKKTNRLTEFAQGAYGTKDLDEQVGTLFRDFRNAKQERRDKKAKLAEPIAGFERRSKDNPALKM